MEMNIILFFKVYLFHFFIQNPIIGLDGFSVLQLTPPPLWAMLNFTVSNVTNLQVVPSVTASSICKMTCFVHTNCSYAVFQAGGQNAMCSMGSLNNATIYIFSPQPNAMSIFNPNGYGLYSITNGTSSRFPKLPDEIIEVAQYTKLYYSLREPYNIYWVLNKHMSRAEAIGNCSIYRNTSLAYFFNLAQLKIGFFILLDQNSTLTTDQHAYRPTMHLDMKTVGTDVSRVATWPIVVGPNEMSISQSLFAGDTRVQINGAPAPTNALYLQWFGGLTFNDHYGDDNVAALCRTEVFGYLG